MFSTGGLAEDGSQIERCATQPEESFGSVEVIYLTGDLALADAIKILNDDDVLELFQRLRLALCSSLLLLQVTVKEQMWALWRSSSTTAEVKTHMSTGWSCTER